MANIVHICPRYFPAHGGAELFFTKISEGLSSLGHAVSVWTTDATAVSGFTSPFERRWPNSERINGVDVRRFPIRHIPAQRYVRTAAHFMPFGTRWKADTLRWTPWVPSLTRAASKADGKVDLVHAAGLPYSSLLFAGVRLAARTKAPLLMTPFTHLSPPGPAGARMRHAYLSPLNLRLLSRADRVFVHTARERQVLAEAGLSPDRQIIVGLGVDPDECTGGSRERARQAWKVSDDAIVIGHLANKSWDKGTVDLLDAAERLWDKGASFRLVLAGPELRSFTERWAKARFPERVVNLGELSDQERRDFFAAIDVFALPSYVESFGVSSLEAALNGSAVVAYDHGGPGEIFRHEQTALLAPVGDVHVLTELIGVLTTNVPERARLAEAACRLASGYSWTRVLDVAVAAYDALLRNERR